MHSNQMLGVVRSLELAKRMGCKVLPLYLAYGPRDYKVGHVTMEHFFEFPDDALIVDLKNPVESAWVAELAMKAGNGSVKWTNNGLDRNILGLHQNDNDTLRIPCIIGKHSANDSRVYNLNKPFRCTNVRIFDETQDIELDGIVGVPMPFLMNVSCTFEEKGTQLVVPRMELQRAAKWILWMVIFGNYTLDAAIQTLASLQHFPLLNDAMYAKSTKVSLYTAHVRTAKWISCCRKMRFGLCGTNDTLAASSLVNATRNTSPIMFLAGDALGGVSWLNNTGTLVNFIRQAQTTRKIVEASHLYGLYKLTLSHPSLNVTDYTPFIQSFGQDAENAHDEALQALMDQIILGCGELRGRFFQTHWSTYSFRARSIGRTIGRQVCFSQLDSRVDLQSGSQEQEEMQRLLQQERDAGVDRSILHFKGSSNEWLPTDKTVGIGCSLKGHFLPSLNFQERLANKHVDCVHCTPGWW
jgi:hypothetical protein